MQIKDDVWKIYVSDSLFCLKRNEIPSKRFVDILHPKKERDADEIALDIISSAGLKVE